MFRERDFPRVRFETAAISLIRAALIPCDRLVGIQAVKIAQLGERLVGHEELCNKFSLSSRYPYCILLR
jgi:hypothetical protein